MITQQLRAKCESQKASLVAFKEDLVYCSCGQREICIPGS